MQSPVHYLNRKWKCNKHFLKTHLIFSQNPVQVGASCVSPFQWRSCRCCVHLVASMHLVAATLVHLVHLTVAHLVATTLVHLVHLTVVHLLTKTLVQLAFSTRVLLLILFWKTHTDVRRIIIAFPQSHRFVSPPLDLLVLVQVARDRG